MTSDKTVVEEAVELREIIAALGYCTSDASLEFMRLIPAEVKAAATIAQRRVEELEALGAAMKLEIERLRAREDKLDELLDEAEDLCVALDKSMYMALDAAPDAPQFIVDRVNKSHEALQEFGDCIFYTPIAKMPSESGGSVCLNRRSDGPRRDSRGLALSPFLENASRRRDHARRVRHPAGDPKQKRDHPALSARLGHG
jgi:hypothetical protein